MTGLTKRQVGEIYSLRELLETYALRQSLEHPLTTAGIERFTSDWETKPEFGEWLRGLIEQSKVPS